MKTIELEPCPFCSGKASIVRTKDVAQWWYAECGKCYTRQLASDTAEKAVDKWNLRKPFLG
jgi:Lar family restriction alleviation protein